MSVQERDVLAAMSTVMDPDLNQDIVKAGMVKDLKIDGSFVQLRIELTTPACPLKEKIKGDADPDPAKSGTQEQPKHTTEPWFPLMAYAFMPEPGIKGAAYIKIFPQRARIFVGYYRDWLEAGLRDPDSTQGKELREPQNHFSLAEAAEALAVLRTPEGQSEVMRKVLNVLFLHEAGHIVADVKDQ